MVCLWLCDMCCAYGVCVIVGGILRRECFVLFCSLICVCVGLLVLFVFVLCLDLFMFVLCVFASCNFL